MTSNELKEKISTNDVKKLMELLGGINSYEDTDVIIYNTICHCGHKNKLYYYKQTKSFHCYTECGSMDIIGLVMSVKDYTFIEAMNWIKLTLNISDEYAVGFVNADNQNTLSDWSFITRFKEKSKPKEEDTFEFNIYDKTILNIFSDVHYQGWIDEGICDKTMSKYNIKYCIWGEKIIIPHYDVNDNLIGIRNRMLTEIDIEKYGKYSPLRVGNTIYNHPLGRNLYGLNKNINAIKKKRKMMLVEGEKSVMQADTMFGDDNFTVALCGLNLSEHQRKMIIDSDVREVIIGMDKQYKTEEESYEWAKVLKKKIIDKLTPYVTVSVLWDAYDMFDYKDSPTDKGYEKLLRLMDNKIIVGTNGGDL